MRDLTVQLAIEGERGAGKTSLYKVIKAAIADYISNAEEETGVKLTYAEADAADNAYESSTTLMVRKISIEERRLA